MKEWNGTFTPRPKHGALESCADFTNSNGERIFEVFCNPDDTHALLDGGIRTVNGLPVFVQIVGEWPEADQLRITFRHGMSTFPQAS